jgi:hypothetical protein
MRKGALFVFAIFARFSLDSARTKIPIAKMAVSQKINRAALDIFILVLFYAPAFGIYCVESQLTHCGSVLRSLRRRQRKRQAKSLSNSGKTYQTPQ